MQHHERELTLTMRACRDQDSNPGFYGFEPNIIPLSYPTISQTHPSTCLLIDMKMNFVNQSNKYW